MSEHNWVTGVISPLSMELWVPAHTLTGLWAPTHNDRLGAHLVLSLGITPSISIRLFSLGIRPDGPFHTASSEAAIYVKIMQKIQEKGQVRFLAINWNYLDVSLEVRINGL